MAQKNDIPLEHRGPLLEAALAHIPFDGWTETAIKRAADDLEVSGEMAELAYPGGVSDLMSAYFARNLARLGERLAAEHLTEMKIRDRITRAVQVKLELSAPEKDVVRKTFSAIALPQFAPLGAKALWDTADAMWRASGDTSTDLNWYSKRTILSGVISSTMLYWVADDSDDMSATHAFLDRRIADVMQIEKAKFEFRKLKAELPSMSRFLSKLRYPDSAR